MIQLKAGVRIFGIRPEVVLAVSVAEGIWLKAGTDTLVITAGIEGTHADGTGGTCPSGHYDGRAVDVRTKNLLAGQAPNVVKMLAVALGPDFFILHEDIGGANEHCHIEFRPAAPYSP